MKKKSLNHEDLKRINRATIVSFILEKRIVSRKDLSLLTGMTHATVGKLVAELIDSGLVVEVGSDTSTKRLGGPNPVLLSIAAGPPYVIAVHIGASRVAVSLVSLRADIIDYEFITAEADWQIENYITIIDQAMLTILRRQKINIDSVIAIGVGTGGIVNSDTGIVKWDEIPALRNAPLKSLLEQKTEKPVFVDNIVEAIALAEAKFGRGKGLNNFVFVFIGSIVGCTTVIKDKIVHGWRHSAGYIGHNIVDSQGPECVCGKRGCLNAIISRTGLIKQAADIMRRTNGSVLERTYKNNNELTWNTIVQAADAGDEECIGLLKYRGYHIGKCLAEAVNLIDPEEILLGINTAPISPQARLCAGLVDNTKLTDDVSQILSTYEQEALSLGYKTNLSNCEKTPPIRFIQLRQENTIVGPAAVAISRIFSSRLDLRDENSSVLKPFIK